jgi:parallel beta-helix repeat protein
VATTLPVAAAPALARTTTAGTCPDKTCHVDGKLGSDTNDGTATRPFKTISRATSWTAGFNGTDAAGYTVIVAGYTDYIYRERPVVSGWRGQGTPTAPIVWKAKGYVPNSRSFVRPIVSGAELATGWSPVSGMVDVWSTDWSDEAAASMTPHTFGKQITAIYQDKTTWLWEQAGLSSLETAARSGKGGYWYDAGSKRLYAAAAGLVGARDPGQYTIDVPVRPTFFFDGAPSATMAGVSRVQVLGFEVRHSANGVAFTNGVDYSVARDNTAVGNLYMGIQVSGNKNTGDTAVGNIVERNGGTANTLQLVKVHDYARDTQVLSNTAYANGLEGIKVESATVERTTVRGNVTYRHIGTNRSGAYGFQTGTNAYGIKVQDGAKTTTIESNSIYGNDIGIHITRSSTSMASPDGTVLKRNKVYSNARFGLSLFQAGSGATTSVYDLYYLNGIGVVIDVSPGANRLDRVTIHGNRDVGAKVIARNGTDSRLEINNALITRNTGGTGYGLYEQKQSTGGTPTLTANYVGLFGNTRNVHTAGSVTGTLYEALGDPRYLSLVTTSPDYLRIDAASPYYTLGTNSSPLGARCRTSAAFTCPN